MGCCMNKRMLIFVLIGVAVFVGLAYAFQWKAVLGYAPFLIFLLCPLMHVFMGGHGGHGGHEDHGQHRDRPTKDKEQPPCH